MLNLLIIENDPNVCKRMINNIVMYVKNIRIYGISYTVKEAIEIVKKQKIDVVILDNDLPNGLAKNFLDFIEENYIEDKMSVIVLAKENENEWLTENKSIFKILYKPVEIPPIVYALRELCGNNNALKQSMLRDKINRELEKLQYNPSYVGTKYMAEAIYEIYSKNYIYKGGNLSRNVYPIIAENHNTTVNNVKCNITSATKCMMQRCPKNMMEDYLFCEGNETPKVKEIMYKVINRI